MVETQPELAKEMHHVSSSHKDDQQVVSYLEQSASILQSSHNGSIAVSQHRLALKRRSGCRSEDATIVQWG